jgi:hypothetical protein
MFSCRSGVTLIKVTPWDGKASKLRHSA